MRARVTLAALGAAIVVTAAPIDAAGAGRVTVLESTERGGGRVLVVDGRRARVERPDGLQSRFAARPEERWLDFADLGDGWLAAGVRFHRRGIDLALVGDLGRGVRRFAGRHAGAALRTGPAVAAGGGELGGVGWLEGDDLARLAVRFAPWADGGFGAPEAVPEAPGGSHSGLRAARLDDGTTLLVWAAFDGRDDEIYWATRAGDGRWTPARRLAAGNRVPDVTPALLPIPGGALVAWSRMVAGEYRVMIARYDGASWTAPTVAGAPGTLSPTFRRRASGDFLLLRDAWPVGWSLFDLDVDGRPLRRARVAAEPREVPRLIDSGGGVGALRWAGGEPQRLDWEAVDGWGRR